MYTHFDPFAYICQFTPFTPLLMIKASNVVKGVRSLF